MRESVMRPTGVACGWLPSAPGRTGTASARVAGALLDATARQEETPTYETCNGDMMPIADRDVLHTPAIHISGHGVVALHLGVRLDSLTLTEPRTKRQGVLGRCDYLGRDLPEDVLQLIALAGPIAEFRSWPHITPTWERVVEFLVVSFLRREEDFKLWRGNQASWRKRKALMLGVAADADDLVQTHWGDITTVADALIVAPAFGNYQQLQGSEVERLISDRLWADQGPAKAEAGR